jgi:DedD protein
MKKSWPSFMDRRLKERLVGATILVVLVVLIVPELLSGPKLRPPTPPAAAVSTAPLHYEVNLATNATTAQDSSAASAASSPAETLPLDRAETPPDGSSAPADHHEPPIQPMSPRPAPPSVTTLQAQPPSAPAGGSPPLENTTASPKSAASARKSAAPAAAGRDGAAEAHHGWTVQLGSFVQRVHADNLQRSLKAKGYAAFVSASGAGAGQRYRVRVGPLADRPAAEREMLRLKKEGHAGSVVAP